MLERKLIVDRFINLTLPAVAVKPYADGEFVMVPLQQHYLTESTGIFTKTSGVQVGTGPKEHRNFIWLPWLSGGISVVALSIGDVLTGPMSGCWLVTYRKANGVPHVAHIGTDIASAAKTKAVKDAWNAFANANQGDLIGGFNPLRQWQGALPAQRGGEGAARMFGLVTTDGRYFAVMTYQQAAPAPNSLLRIAGIQQIPPTGPAQLRDIN